MQNIFKPRTSKNYPALDFHQLLADQIHIESLVKQLKDYGQTSKQRLNKIIDTSEHILYNQPTVLRLSSPIRIVGDIHGQFHDLLYILEHYGQFPHDNFLFLGDYVDRGQFCVEVMTLLLALKCKYPKSIYLLRGNHQGKTMTQYFNFKLQCNQSSNQGIKKYNLDIYDRFTEVFCKLPLCALVDNLYFCVHGGISPNLKIIKQLEKMDRFKEIQQVGLMCDLLWSDPVNTNVVMWEKNKSRSCSYVFSRKHANKFITQNNIEMIIRGHEVQMKGFAYQMNDFRKKLTLTIFSAPNYCDKYRNKGGVAIINKGSLTIQTFSQSPHPFVFPNYMNILQWSLPIIGTKTSHMFLHLLKMIDKGDDNSGDDDNEVMDKLQYLSDILESKKTTNIQLLFNPDNSEGTDLEEDFQKFFSMKKINDQCEKYPQLPQPVIGPKIMEFKKVLVVSEQGDEGYDEDVLPLTEQTWDAEG